MFPILLNVFLLSQNSSSYCHTLAISVGKTLKNYSFNLQLFVDFGREVGKTFCYCNLILPQNMPKRLPTIKHTGLRVRTLGTWVCAIARRIYNNC
jgi:hypothetical protein